VSRSLCSHWPLQDIGRHRYFNTNNLWLDLHAVRVRRDDAASAAAATHDTRTRG
jgi:hypothetical protein